ncbi:M23 family metallopeptidase [uncultured Thiothrix sp.]|uniref:M23 family metallopeptidase n=1 Tax=uncultured Thiothrix sp. TaxID=223185 RepID=UPI00262DABD1|nr:M23 family metallopeptidase [uncultured Thiothrix sp.]HMT91845.1 M23 family metallopeptidase [Thiolinea sp.]
MKVICISRDGARRASFSLNPITHLVLPASLVALLIIGLSVNQMLGLYRLDNTPQQNSLTAEEAEKILTTLGEQMNTVNEIKKTYSSYTVDVDTLSVRLGTLEAEIARLNALAKRVVNRAKLDPKEFSLDQAPPRGGLEEDYTPAVAPRVTTKELLGSFENMESKLEQQRAMLESLYQVLEEKALAEVVLPSSRPVKFGYISSQFGARRDPFNGGMRMHKGMDYAGPRGTDVHAVAGGIVSFVGTKGGYGTLVEIDHGNGLVSRYAHLDQALVEQGRVIQKADRVALLGNTGRSTGAHLHLEILRNGEAIDPQTYLGLGE